jgi:hypothetical protein
MGLLDEGLIQIFCRGQRMPSSGGPQTALSLSRRNGQSWFTDPTRSEIAAGWGTAHFSYRRPAVVARAGKVVSVCAHSAQ